MRSDASTRLSLGQRVVACLLLVVIVFFVVNPLWECHDHMDNLRHLGSNGFLLIVLLIACAGITLLKSLRWFSLNVRRAFLLSPQPFIQYRQACDKFLLIQPGDLLLPLRI